MEILKLKGIDEDTIAEMNKDIKRLEIITERFSKIGSIPELSEQNLETILRESIDYMRPRASKKISIELVNLQPEIPVFKVNLNQHLFEWVIENLFRNAIDAMEGQGGALLVEFGEKGKWLYIDVSDTGKGIPKSMVNTVFEPGYTSKKRGWGLGLSLSRRIIENYHRGKIFVKRSEPGKGTTFRILLPRYWQASTFIFPFVARPVSTAIFTLQFLVITSKTCVRHCQKNSFTAKPNGNRNHFKVSISVAAPLHCFRLSSLKPF
jgi:signal transduction histidine kinase